MLLVFGGVPGAGKTTLARLCVAVLAAGTITAWLSARATIGREVALAVKEDW